MKEIKPTGQHLDFRIKIFNIFYKTMKALRLFKIQKIVRSIKKEDDKEQLPKLEKKLNFFKNISAQQIRDISYHILRYKLSLDVEPVQAFLKRQVKVTSEEYLNEDADAKQFLEKIEGTPRYKTALDQIDDILGMVNKKKNKTKLKREYKKQRFILKKQTKGEKQVQKEPRVKIPKDSAETEKQNQSRKNENQKQPQIKKQISKTKNQHQVKNPKGKKEIKATEIKQLDPVVTVQKPDFSFQSLHPSWQAKIEQKQMVGNLNLFQGKKIKLN